MVGGAGERGDNAGEARRLVRLPADTSIEAHRVQIEAYRRLGPDGRVALMAQMCDDERELCREGIRARHPEYTPEQIRRALLRLLHGDELTRLLFPGQPLVRP